MTTFVSTGIADFYYSEKHSISLSTPGFSSGAAPARAAANPQEKETGGTSAFFEPWGDGNDFPSKIIDLYSKDPIIPETFLKKVSMITMSDVMAVQKTGQDGEKELVEWVDDPEITAFLNNPVNKRYLVEAASDLVWFSNAFPEVILSRDHSKILYICHQEAAYCRYSKRNAKGVIENVLLNANWPSVQKDDPLTIVRKCLDPYSYDRIEWIRNMKDGSYIHPLTVSSPGKSFYQLANHDSIRSGGWLDVHLAIPKFKKSMMQNEMSVKYHIEVAMEYWEMRFGKVEWEKKTAIERQESRREFLIQMDKMLASTDNAGKSIMTDMKWDDIKASYRSYVKITELGDKSKDGKHLQDGQEAASNIFYAMGMDPTIAGFVGKDVGARSGGSDKREAWLILVNMLKPYRDPLLEPYYIAAEYNGWTAKYPNLQFKFRDVVLTTLDTGAGTKKVLS